jgi:hypothetical protein
MKHAPGHVDSTVCYDAPMSSMRAKPSTEARLRALQRKLTPHFKRPE